MPQAVTAYFRNLVDTARTVLDGMAVTASHLVRKPSTVQYPDRTEVPVRDMLPFRYRGILAVDMEICTGCMACLRACPIDCIRIDAAKDKETRALVMTRFDIDIIKCMYCGLCSEPCPTGAIHHTPEFEGASFSVRDMVRHFVREPVTAYRPKKAGEDNPDLQPLVERGKLYIGEFAAPEKAKPAPKPAPRAAPAAPEPEKDA